MYGDRHYLITGKYIIKIEKVLITEKDVYFFSKSQRRLQMQIEWSFLRMELLISELKYGKKLIK